MEAIVPGEPARLNEFVVRVTAPNPGMMTGPGTNTYIVGTDDLALIDPGPESLPHLAAMRDAVGPRLKWILCTHTHLDHSPGARALKAETGAQLLGFGAVPDDGRQDAAFAPDRRLRDGDVLDCGAFRLRAVHTPGHASNHLCYLLEHQKLLFTGDHIMQGSTVVISPPDGDMIAYLGSLERLLSLDLAAVAPGHGHVIERPHDEVRRLIAHRTKRERKVLDALGKKSPATLDDLLPLVYDDVSPGIHPVARRSLHAHLIKLRDEGKAAESGATWKLQ
ncbi:MAG: MBL fold metallo-hydrolase [Betaproteobacteria bacterium RIFCSPLOWO2_02_FULL_67_26]|nr:MAG: MBL fold metallo-hydrolase [Betaproteobacteria bacterium RIFCSPLOWO2_02_FULL_67_26]